jgi:hypothetical protein
MGQWGDQPFESDGGLDAVFDVLDYLIKKVQRTACGPHPPDAALTWDKQELAANVELLCLVAEEVYRPAVANPVRGMPLPPPKEIADWRESFLTRWGQLAKRQFGRTPAELELLGVEAAAPLVRLGELSLRQTEQSEATYGAVVEERIAASKQETAKEKKSVKKRGRNSKNS